MLGMIAVFEDYPIGMRYVYPEYWFEQVRIQAKMYGCTHYGVIDLSQYKIGQYYSGTDSDISYFYWQDVASAEFALNAGGFTKWFIGSRAKLNAEGITHVSIEDVTQLPPGDLAFIMLPDDNNLADAIITGRSNENWISVPHGNVADPVAAHLMTVVFYHRFLVATDRIP
jgi:hypothetical protein